MAISTSQNCIRLKQPIEDMAYFLCRSRSEVPEKIAELERSGELRRPVAKAAAGAQQLSDLFDNERAGL